MVHRKENLHFVERRCSEKLGGFNESYSVLPLPFLMGITFTVYLGKPFLDILSPLCIVQ